MPASQGKTVLITGASSGIGKVTALYLAEKGYSVIGTSRSSERLADLQSEASVRGLSLTAIELDINSDDFVSAPIEELSPVWCPQRLLSSTA